MNTQNIAEIVVSVVVAIIGILTPYLANFIKNNKTARTLVDVLPTLAKDAVVAMQKLGVDQYLEGELKKSKAVTFVESALENLGFKSTDATTIKNAVESAYADLVKKGTLSVYTQKTEADVKAETEAEKLAAAKKALADAQATVTTLESASTTSSAATK
ncbi:phage holin, LLH family [Liquorilactobacillus nagelii]|uniref:phage holin, LLH family n=1 Tax=Liquorilactobacillus nagelii TaxID=82688 RepID=UPI001CCB8336|nr:phage holin, LLH family [Liquorilactobacillus nagelii]ULQ49066.1 phage holin, LLH family [Liquorilactobacillus nagelii]